MATLATQLLIPRQGTVTLSGYGIKVHVDRGHLILDDGIGATRHRARLPRVGHGLERLVVIGSDGVVSLAALRWLADQNAAFVMLDRDGSVLATTGPVRSSDARLRRAQALAVHTGAALNIVRELIGAKVMGQELVARDSLGRPEIAEEISELRKALKDARSIQDINRIESQAAVFYWSGWSNVGAAFPKNQLPRVPDHWKVFGGRHSPLSGSSRLAVSPANAMLNYLYALLEAEATLAIQALGLDPGLGVLHLDRKNRDSLACDLMEPIRPRVDAYVLQLLRSHSLRREWFFEQRNGNCRLMSGFTEQLAETLPTWRRAVAPWAEWFARSLWSPSAKAPKQAPPPTRLTQQHKRVAKGGNPLPKPIPLPSPASVCHGCGSAVLKHSRHCPACSAALSSERLKELAIAGRVAAQSAKAQATRAETQHRNALAQRAWAESEQPRHAIDEETYRTQIQPALATVKQSAIASALGVSKSYAANIQRGKRVPHPRHWGRLSELVRESSTS